MGERFKAAVLVRQDEPLIIENFFHQEPMKGQVKVKLVTSSLCGAQLNEIHGVKGVDKYLPHFMGHEGFGEVVSVGVGVTRVSTGDSVILHWRKALGSEVFGGTYESESLGKVGSGSVTTFSEYTIVSENRVTPINPVKGNESIYPLLGCALSTAYGITTIETHPRLDDSLLIVGAGGLGLALAAILRVRGFSKVSMIERSSEKDELIASLGAEVFRSMVSCDGQDFAFIYETTGVNALIESSFSRLGKGGSLVLVGQPKIGSNITLRDPLKFFDGKKIFASDGGGFNPSEHMSSLLELVEPNAEIFQRLVTHVIELNDINSGFDLMRGGLCGRVVVKF